MSKIDGLLDSDQAMLAAAAGDDVLFLLRRVMQRYPVLTQKQEVELSKRVSRGDLVAKETFVLSNLGLVLSSARQHVRRAGGLTFEDLVQEGILGLIRAVEKFDWRKGFKFSTYATHWIRQSMDRGIDNNADTIRVPIHVATRCRKLYGIEAGLKVKLGREPTVEELAKAAELPVEVVNQTRQARRPVASLEAPLGDDDQRSYADLVVADDPEPVESASQRQAERAISEALETLSTRERKVVTLRFGLMGEGPTPLGEIARVMRLDLDQVRAIEHEALSRLKDAGELAALAA